MTVEVRPASQSFNFKESQSLIERASPPDSVVLDFVNRPEIAAKIHPKWAFFNRAVFHWPQDNSTYSLERVVNRDYLRENLPDRSVIVVVKQDQYGNLKRLPDLKLPLGDVFNWEDPRVEVNGKSVRVGLTAVKKKNNGSYPYSPHPAIVELAVNGCLEVSNIQIFDNVEGKNVVPVDSGFIFRREGIENFHTLDYVVPDSEALLKTIQRIDFSRFKNTSWISEKVGAVAHPFEFREGNKILFVHGVRRGNPLSNVDYIYSLGFCITDSHLNLLAVDTQPLVVREHFLEELSVLEDLSQKKSVVYACGVEETKNGTSGKVDEHYKIHVNFGDRITKTRQYAKSAIYERAQRILEEASGFT